MYVWARMITAFRASRKVLPEEMLHPVTMPLRVWFSDVDIFGHLNNGRYLTICDLGRFQLGAMTGMNQVFVKKGWHPVVASAAIRFRRSLNLLVRFELSTQLLWWDEKWFYIEHRFIKDNSVYSKVLIKATVLDKNNQKVPVAELIAALGVSLTPPSEHQAMMTQWQNFEASFK